MVNHRQCQATQWPSSKGNAQTAYENSSVSFYSIANRSAQNAITMVKGPNAEVDQFLGCSSMVFSLRNCNLTEVVFKT